MHILKLGSCFTFPIVLLYFILNINCTHGQNVDKAVQDFLMQQSVTANKTGFDLDTWDPPEEMKKNLVYYHSGFDEDNRPIWVAEWGKWDVRKYFDAGGQEHENFDRYIDQQIRRMLQSMPLRSTPENPVNEFIFIIDMEDYPLAQLTSAGSIVYQLGKFASWNQIALSIQKGFIVNANAFAEQIINLTRPVLGAAFSRFEVYGTNKERWLPKLLKQVPRAELPEWYGGAKDFKPVKVYGRK